jgi:hypothetical protein
VPLTYATPHIRTNEGAAKCSVVAPGVQLQPLASEGKHR